MRNAIILARLMQSDELKDEKNASAQYKIVKSFADCYLFRGKEKITSDEFSEKLLQIKKEIANQK